jgi:uroporphyrinogen decarboxylase
MRASAMQAIADSGDHFVVVGFGFGLFERTWTLRGFTNLFLDFYDHPAFVHELLGAIADWNIAQLRHALDFDIDAVLFGDDWGMQRGVIMGPGRWREFIKPRVRQMYGLVRSKGRKVFIHSCGKVDELFPDLIECGVDVFNPFQPEVMDTAALLRKNSVWLYWVLGSIGMLPPGFRPAGRASGPWAITVQGPAVPAVEPSRM